MKFRQVLSSIVFTVISTIIIMVLNACLHNFINGDIYGSKITSYEKSIEATVINATDIKEKLEDIGGLDRIKEDIVSNILLPLKYPKIFSIWLGFSVISFIISETVYLCSR